MKDIPKEIEDALVSWTRMKNIWRLVHYCLGIVGILCSVCAAYINAGIPAFLSLIAAICFGWLAFLLPSNKALAYERALSMLAEQVLKYKTGQNYAFKYVIDAKKKRRVDHFK